MSNAVAAATSRESNAAVATRESNAVPEKMTECFDFSMQLEYFDTVQ
jgi:hypothetical protein